MKERKIPMRKCVGCMESREKQYLSRIAIFEGKLNVDPDGRAKGRGIYICKDRPECFELALKRKALERAAKRAVSEEEKEAIRAELEASR